MDKSLLKSNYLAGFLQNRILIILPLILIAFGLLLSGDVFAYTESTPEDQLDILSLIYSETENNNPEIFPPKVITVMTKDGEQTVIAYADTVEEFLISSGFELDFNDLVFPELTVSIIHNGVIKVVEVDVEFSEVEKDIPFEYVRVESEEYNTGQFVITQDGADGLQINTLRSIYQDGVLIKSEVVKTQEVLGAMAHVTTIGTKPITIASCEYWHEVVDNVVPETDNTKREWFKYVTWRETGCDSGKTSRIANGAFKGLMQYLPSTFSRYGGDNIWDGYEQILIASQIYDEKMKYGDIGWEYLANQWPPTNEFLAGARYKAN